MRKRVNLSGIILGFGIFMGVAAAASAGMPTVTLSPKVVKVGDEIIVTISPNGWTLKTGPTLAGPATGALSASGGTLTTTGPGYITVDTTWERPDGQGGEESASVTGTATVVKLIDLILASGPTYTPVGESVAGKPFEAEKNDRLVLMAVTEPEGMGGELLEWSGDGVDGNGLTKNVVYGDTGTKQVYVSLGDDKLETTIHVNANAENPIYATISVDGSRWAHHATETVTLTANAHDYDWVEGELKNGSEDNRIDWDRSSWKVDEKWGKVFPKEGNFTVWKPPYGKYSSNVVITFKPEDYSDEYSPRDESFGSQAEVSVGCFVVVGKVQQGNGNAFVMDDMGGTRSGSKPDFIREDKFISAEAAWHGSTNHMVPYESVVPMSWTTATLPGEAVPNGNMYITVGTEGKAEGYIRTLDNDSVDGFFVEIGVTYSLAAKGFGFNVDFGKLELGFGDGAEGVATMAAGFGSDKGFLGTVDDRQAIEDKSSDHSDFWYQLWKPAKPFNYSYSRKGVRKLVEKGNQYDAEWRFCSKVEAKIKTGFPHRFNMGAAQASISSQCKAILENVEYEPVN